MAIGTLVVGTEQEDPAQVDTAVPYAGSPALHDLMMTLGVDGSTSPTALSMAAWTQIDQDSQGGTAAPAVAAFRKFAVGTESGTVTLSHGSIAVSAIMASASGVDQTTPLDIAVITTDTGVASSTISFSATIITPGCTAFLVASTNSTSTTLTGVPVGWTAMTSHTAGRRSWGAAFKQNMSAGATGTLTLTFSGSAKSVGYLIVWRPAVASVSVSISETVSGSDAIASNGTASRSLSETVSGTDSTARSSSAARATAETVTGLDAVSRTGAAARAAAESVTGTDAVTRSAHAARGSTETVSGTDAVARHGSAARAAAETVTGIDAVTTASFRSHATSIGENLTTSDSTTRHASAGRLMLEPLTLADAVTRAAAASRTVLETLVTIDTVQSTQPIQTGVRILGFHEYQRPVTFTEYQRLIVFEDYQQPITFDQEAPVHLSRQGVERYRPRPTTTPTVDPGDWIASFDGGQTWVDAVVKTDQIVDGEPTWLLAHSTVADPPEAATVMPALGRVIPAVKLGDDDQVLIRDVTFEEGQGQPPEIILG